MTLTVVTVEGQDHTHCQCEHTRSCSPASQSRNICKVVGSCEYALSALYERLREKGQKLDSESHQDLKAIVQAAIKIWDLVEAKGAGKLRPVFTEVALCVMAFAYCYVMAATTPIFIMSESDGTSTIDTTRSQTLPTHIMKEAVERCLAAVEKKIKAKHGFNLWTRISNSLTEQENLDKQLLELQSYIHWIKYSEDYTAIIQYHAIDVLEALEYITALEKGDVRDSPDGTAMYKFIQHASAHQAKGHKASEI